MLEAVIEHAVVHQIARRLPREQQLPHDRRRHGIAARLVRDEHVGRVRTNRVAARHQRVEIDPGPRNDNEAEIGEQRAHVLGLPQIGHVEALQHVRPDQQSHLHGRLRPAGARIYRRVVRTHRVARARPRGLPRLPARNGQPVAVGRGGLAHGHAVRGGGETGLAIAVVHGRQDALNDVELGAQ